MRRPTNGRQRHERDPNATATATMADDDDNDKATTCGGRGTYDVRGGGRDDHDEDNEGALVLAAEAAAALIAGGDNGGIDTGRDGVVVDGAALEAVAAGVMLGEGGDRTTRRARGTDATAGSVDGVQHDQDAGGEVDRSSSSSSSSSFDFEFRHPSGPSSSSSVRTFVSRVPTSTDPREMSIAQRNFIDRYYDVGRGGDGGVGHVAGGGIVAGRVGGGRRRDGDEYHEGNDYDESPVVASGGGGEPTRADDDVIDDDEFDEVIEEEGEDDVFARRDDNVDAFISKISTVSEGIGGGTTLRTVCRRIPRSFGGGGNDARKERRSGRKREKENTTDEVGVTKFNEGRNGADVNQMTEDAMVEEARMAGKADDHNEDDVSVGRLRRRPRTCPQPPPPPMVEPPIVGPRVTFDESGFIVIDQGSLLPNPESRQSTSEIDAELGNDAVVDEGESACKLGAVQARHDSYSTKTRAVPMRWTPRETRAFYDALRQCGTDFGLMQMYCTGRTRMQLKRKFKVESRKNARLVDMALDPKCKVRLDLSVFGDDLEIPEEVTPIEGGSMPQVSSGGAGEEVGKEDDPTSRDDVILSQAMRTVDSRSRALQNLRNFTDF
ncbi:hypothetical protein ACHAXA_010273 [Cyclostephanos tholiformis]|uniref:Myb-like domain-containing protein n=1 Tax=Cyclostephanos tholiformis TaxID=382380 RepID=A0ABD3RSJ7_9STRA